MILHDNFWTKRKKRVDNAMDICYNCIKVARANNAQERN